MLFEADTFSGKLNVLSASVNRSDGVDSAAFRTCTNICDECKRFAAALAGGLVASAVDQLIPYCSTMGVVYKFNQFSACREWSS